MTNYNDGKWHGWNGGDCPVHPKTVVEVVHADDGCLFQRRAGVTLWGSESLVAFRVVKEHREPREAYFAQLGIESVWLEVLPEHPKAVLFREVLDE